MKLGMHVALALGLGDCAPIAPCIRLEQDGSEGWNHRLPSSAAAAFGIEAASVKAPGELFRVVTQGALP
jgi:hypothetical protein